MKTIYKYKCYAHFDSKKKVNTWINYIEDPQSIIRHGFYPFVHYILKTWKYDNSKQDTKTKPRDINYAAHIDRYIYEYYNSLLNTAYNEYAKKNGINKCSVAYRNNLHKNNIHIAKEVFNHIKNSKDSFIIVSDFSKYFDKINHAYLKKKLREVLNTKTLSEDWYKVFKSITHYSYIDLEVIAAILDISVCELRKRNKLCSEEEFKEIKKYIKTNTNNYGIPQGSSISATLANINLITYDKEINDYVTARNGIYRRYCDDTIIVLPIEYRSEFISFYNSQNGLIPGLIVNEDKIKHYNLISGSIHAINGRPSWLRYLGFEFNGRDTRIREGTITAFYLKSYRSIRKINQLSARYGRKAYRQYFFKTFTHLGRNRGKRNRGNFLTYVEKCSEILEEKRIKKQVKNHWRNFCYKLKGL